jgi:NAD(P)-dependent dehydrogenase (short-subunit alcohol dehydrogenase family)
MSCESKVAIVTGAAGGGMGRSIALTLAREKAQVVVNYRTSVASATTIVDAIRHRGGRAIAVQADVFDSDGCRTLVDRTIEEFGQVNICVVGPGGGWHPEPIDRLDSAGALEDVHHEVAPLFHLMPRVLPRMYQRKWGRVIAIALHPTKQSPAYAYNVGKAARTHAMLLAQDQAWNNGVTINVVAPGPVPAIDSLDDAIEQCDHGPAWSNRTTTSPQDVAESVAFLCSDAGRFITGCVLPYRFSE